MPYKIVFIEGGDRVEIGPLACDNPKSEYGFNDKSIERKAKRLAAKYMKDFSGLECFVENYDES